jgi:hypothetical protein
MRTIVSVVVLGITTCQANPFDGCTLKNMAGVSSDAAAKFVREACLGKVSSEIPLQTVLVTPTAVIGSDRVSGGSNLYINLNNQSPYAITELMAVIESNSQTTYFEATNFLEVPAGLGVIAGLPPDPADYLQIKPFSKVYFAVPIGQLVTKGKWDWNVISAKGHLATGQPGQPRSPTPASK